MSIWSPTFRLEREQLIPKKRSDVFDFFSDAFNLEALTPGFLNFSILTAAPIDIAEGTLIDYRISLFGIPMKWKTRIERFETNTMFVDRQIKGPYTLWHHTHTFEDVPEGTLMRDVVDYRLPFGPLGILAHALFVKRTLHNIFQYRYDSLERLMGEI